MAEWFEDWFNTEEYLDVYKHRDQEDAKDLVKLILSNVEIEDDANILDMACGAGRHSIIFAKRGYKVTAVDLSENLLGLAKSSAEDKNVNVDFINSDLRNFSISKKFELAVSLFTSFGYFEEDEENFNIFRIAHKHLEKNGYFVLDYFNKNFIEQNLVPITVEKLGAGKIKQSRSIEGNRVVKKISIAKNGEEKHYYESVRMYDETELTKAILKTGFKIEQKFGDFYGHHFDLENSPRIIIIARK